ncbi:hypothetical protein ACLOJK_003202 [Asimina triloba]
MTRQPASSPFLPSPSRARSPLPLSSLAVVACSPPSPRRRPLLHACSPFFPRRRRLLPASPRRRRLLVPAVPSPSSPAPPCRPLAVVPCPSLPSSFPSPLPASFFLPPVSLPSPLPAFPPSRTIPYGQWHECILVHRFQVGALLCAKEARTRPSISGLAVDASLTGKSRLIPAVVSVRLLPSAFVSGRLLPSAVVSVPLCRSITRICV